MNLDRRLLQKAQTAKIPLALTVFFGWLAGILLVGQAYLLSLTVNGVFLEHQTLSDVGWLLGLIIVLGLFRAACVWGSQSAAQRMAGQIKSELRQRLVTHLLALGPGFTQGERSGELTNTITEGVEALDAYFSQYLPQLVVAALVPLSILVFVFRLDPISGAVLLLTAPLIPLFMVLIGSQAEALTRRQWTTLSRMSAHFLDVLQGLTTLKIFGRSRQQIEIIALVSDRFRQTTMSVLRVAFLSALVLEMLATISTAIVAVEVGLRLLNGHLLFQEAFFVLILAPEFYLPLRMLGTRFHDGIAGTTAARRIFQILDIPSPAKEGTSALCPPPPFQLRLTDVHYAYQAGERPALNGLSFQISPGQKVALVGPSGGGKTTILHLLLRFIDPDRGQITVDDRPIQDLDAAAWRAQLSWVPQNPYLFHASVEDNIRLACPQASHEQIVLAANQAHAHDFIQSLPLGYDTPIGERGARLSGGQAQRLALARAFLKDAPFLVLDEPSANLDPEYQARLQESITALMQNRTVLIVAHRLSTVVDADQILVIDRGRVVESGKHPDLVEHGGLYHRLVTAHV